MMSYWSNDHLQTEDIPSEIKSYEGYHLAKITSEFGFELFQCTK